MAARRQKGSKPKKAKKRTQQTPSQPARRRQRKQKIGSEAARWLRLLADPCAAELVRPCYTGADAGYVVRTHDVYQPVASGTGLTIGAKYRADYFVQYTPWNISGSFGLTQGSNTQGGNLTMVASGIPENFVTTAVVKRYRPVAACIRWIPDGPYTDRAGSVGVNYSAGVLVTPGNVIPMSNLLRMAAKVVPNGSMEHEVKWLPTEVDENWTTTLENANGSAGTVSISLSGIDGVASSTTGIALNGRLEVITCWEWLPAVGQGDLTVSVRSPAPYTSQQVLSSIRDMGHFLYEGAGMAARRVGFSAMGQVLTAGVRTIAYRAPAMLTM